MHEFSRICNGCYRAVVRSGFSISNREPSIDFDICTVLGWYERSTTHRDRPRCTRLRTAENITSGIVRLHAGRRTYRVGLLCLPLLIRSYHHARLISLIGYTHVARLARKEQSRQQYARVCREVSKIGGNRPIFSEIDGFDGIRILQSG